jgi:hypothetical protein
LEIAMCELCANRLPMRFFRTKAPDVIEMTTMDSPTRSEWEEVPEGDQGAGDLLAVAGDG